MRVYVFRLAMLTLAVLGPVVARGDDQQIAEQIIEKLDSEKQAGALKGFSIDLSVEEGTVWMSGRVANAEQHAKALDIARRIPGVKQVVNDLTVNGDTPTFTPREAQPSPATAGAQELAPRAPAPRTAAPRNTAYQPMPMPAPAPQQKRVGGLFANFGSAMQNAGGRGSPQRQQPIYQQMGAEEEVYEPTPASTSAGSGAIGTGVTSRRVVQAVLPVPAEDVGLATSEPLTSAPDQSVAQSLAPAYARPQYAVPVYRGSTNQVPLAYAPARQVQHEGAIEGVSGGPVPMHMAGSGVGIAPARYDHPSMPGYAWPSYAAYPNYAAVTYPKQYSPTAWPYIGPFYPYPQVPLGWRKVTLEWDDGWWMLDFKDRRNHTH